MMDDEDAVVLAIEQPVKTKTAAKRNKTMVLFIWTKIENNCFLDDYLL